MLFVFLAAYDVFHIARGQLHASGGITFSALYLYCYRPIAYHGRIFSTIKGTKKFFCDTLRTPVEVMKQENQFAGVFTLRV